MDAVVKGLVFGLVLAMLIGPVFFALIETSIEYGFRRGVFVAIGIALSDTMYIIVSYYGLTSLLADETMDKYLGYAGGCILIGFGVFSFFKSQRKQETVDLKLKAKGFKRFIFKGFMINGINPMVLFFWIGAISLATVEHKFSTSDTFMFFLSIIATVFFTDVLKVYLANKLRSFVTQRSIKILNIVTGIAMILFGIKLLIYAVP